LDTIFEWFPSRREKVLPTRRARPALVYTVAATEAFFSRVSGPSVID
jgi:hypothetical protein